MAGPKIKALERLLGHYLRLEMDRFSRGLCPQDNYFLSFSYQSILLSIHEAHNTACPSGCRLRNQHAFGTKLQNLKYGDVTFSITGRVQPAVIYPVDVPVPVASPTSKLALSKST